MKRRDKEILMERLNKFNEAATNLMLAISHFEGDFNDLNAIEKYPFEKSFDEVVLDIDEFTTAVNEELAIRPQCKNHVVVEGKKTYFTAQVVNEEDGKTYDMTAIILDEAPADDDEDEVVPFKIISHYHGEPSVADTGYFIDRWEKQCATMMRVHNYLQAYLETNEGYFASPRESELYNEPLVRQTLNELEDIIMYKF